jgi:hypothetical protein
MARPRRKPARHKAEAEITKELTARAILSCAGCGKPVSEERMWWLSNGRPCHVDNICWNRAKELPHV